METASRGVSHNDSAMVSLLTQFMSAREKQNVHAYKRIVNANDNNNDNNDKNAASTRGGVPELHVSNVNGKPQSKSNGHVSPATHDNVKTEATFVRSPSEAAARFRAAHTSGPVSIPLHHLKNTNTATSNKSHFNDNHNLTENDYCTPQKESDTNVTNNTGDKVRPVRRGSREDHMISLQTPKHPHESPQSKKTPNSNNDNKEVNANDMKEKNVLNGERK
ncbi:hypothetical protein O3M35_006933 [Rhynocoris fuscipes]|uniref:Uncharacterized protein n=1 Tax=Rhynocoris fuscipes TaxID=488301 RepID=A0AAW1DMV9_9HEMI